MNRLDLGAGGYDTGGVELQSCAARLFACSYIAPWFTTPNRKNTGTTYPQINDEISGYISYGIICHTARNKGCIDYGSPNNWSKVCFCSLSSIKILTV
jgi:hypothetical protein